MHAHAITCHITHIVFDHLFYFPFQKIRAILVHPGKHFDFSRSLNECKLLSSVKQQECGQNSDHKMTTSPLENIFLISATKAVAPVRFF